MAQPPPTPSPPVAVVPSTRIRLARAALGGAHAVPAVVRGDAGPSGACVTSDPPVVLEGVSVVAQPGGRFEVGLSLVAQLVPLHELAEAVRREVAAAAARDGLDDRLGEVSVDFVDVLAPGELP